MSGQLLNFNLQNVLLGLALGAATGLVRTHSPLARISAFLIGFALGMAFYVLRLAVLPATWLGNAVAVVIVLMLMTTISALTRDRQRRFRRGLQRVLQHNSVVVRNAGSPSCRRDAI